MPQTITVSGKIPEDFPSSFTKPEVLERAKEVIRKRLALRPEDVVIINITG